MKEVNATETYESYATWEPQPCQKDFSPITAFGARLLIERTQQPILEVRGYQLDMSVEEPGADPRKNFCNGIHFMLQKFHLHLTFSAA